MINYGKLYDEFLYDCYIANQRLTDDDWFYYGKEIHHVEIPSRDGGLLTPLNSQPLTLYQHWIAGVLQSEVLGRCCFAFIPKEQLPSWLELLRTKWRRHEQTQRWSTRTETEKSKMGKKAWEKISTEERKRLAKLASDAAREANAAVPHETRSLNAKKSWETRRRNQQGG